jgi:hypothetical protein
MDALCSKWEQQKSERDIYIKERKHNAESARRGTHVDHIVNQIMMGPVFNIHVNHHKLKH